MTSPTQTLAADAERNEKDAERALNTLKSLLIEDEHKQLDELQRRLDDPLTHTEEVALILPQALRRAKDTDLAMALARPLTKSILRAVRHEPKAFAEAVFPILGPTIRRAVAEALRDMVRKLNRVLDHSFSPRGLRWRLEAWRSGMTFSEVVLRHTLEYRVEQAFLIRSDDGVLIAHVSAELDSTQDPDAYSAMLTAIQSFYKDTIDVDESINAVDLIEHTALLVHGPLAYIACVIDGEPPMELRGELSDILAEIHARYSDKLKVFSGDRKDATVMEPELERCLIAKENAAAYGQRGFSKLALFFLGLVIAALGWISYSQWQKEQLRKAEHTRQTQAVSLLGNVPGIVVTDAKLAPGQLKIQGLRDPLAQDPEQLLTRSGLEIVGLQADWRLYQAAEPEIALQRARLRLNPPEDVVLELAADGRLIATGNAEQTWISRATLLAPTVPGIVAMDTSGLISSDALLLREAKARLTPPTSVTMAANNGELTLSGTAPQQWINAIPERIAGATGLRQLSLYELTSAEYLQLGALRTSIEDTRIPFTTGATEITEAHAVVLDDLAKQLSELLQLARQFDVKLSILVIGRTDSTGSPVKNETVALERALNTREALRERGIPETAIEPNARPLLRKEEQISPELRRVDFKVKLDLSQSNS